MNDELREVARHFVRAYGQELLGATKPEAVIDHYEEQLLALLEQSNLKAELNGRIRELSLAYRHDAGAGYTLDPGYYADRKATLEAQLKEATDGR